MLSVWIQALVAPVQIARKSSSARGSSPIRAVPEEEQEFQEVEDPEQVANPIPLGGAACIAAPAQCNADA